MVSVERRRLAQNFQGLTNFPCELTLDLVVFFSSSFASVSCFLLCLPQSLEIISLFGKLTIVSIWRENMLVRGHYLKTVSFEEHITSKDKYPGIFLPQMEAIVFIILQIFFATRAVFKIGEYPRIFPSFGWGIFGHLTEYSVTRLDQSRASENI